MSDLHMPGPFDPRSQRFRDYARQRQMSLSDLLLENRIIFLSGVINDMSGIQIVMQMLYLQYENRTQDIHLYINCPGGSVTATLEIYDTMQFLECPIATYCMGLAASGGGHYADGRHQGQAFALPNSKVMIHQPWGQVGGQVSDIEIQANEITKEPYASTKSSPSTPASRSIVSPRRLTVIAISPPSRPRSLDWSMMCWSRSPTAISQVET